LKTFFKTLLKIFFVAVALGVAFFLYLGWKNFDFNNLELGYARAIYFLRKNGVSVVDSLDESAGSCSTVVVKKGGINEFELLNEPFPYGTPLKLDFSLSRTMPLCKFKVPGVGFTVSPLPAAVVAIFREANKPGIVELKSGGASISSEKMEVVLKLPNLNLLLKSENKATVLIDYKNTSVNIRVGLGSVTAQTEQAAQSEGNDVAIWFYASNGTKLSVNGSPAFSSEMEGKWLPSGFSISTSSKTAPAKP